MFCVRCGKYNPDKEKKCKYCGGDLSKNEKYKAEVPVGSFYGSENKESAGSVLTFLFGVIAFIIGVLLYFEEPEKRNTFIKGVLKAFWHIL